MPRQNFLRLSPPFRAEHVGSLLRPRALYDKRVLLDQGKCSPEGLTALEDAAIEQAVKLQQQVGIKSVTDGEMRRAVFFEGVFDKLEGMTALPDRPIAEFKPYIPHIAFLLAAGLKTSPSIYCTGKIKRVRPFYVDPFKHLKSLVPEQDVRLIKMTMCSPSWFHQRHGSDLTYDRAVYKNDDEYFDALGVVYREEIQELYGLGCRHIQFDDPTFCYFCNDAMISGMEEAGVNHEALLTTYIRAINVCVRDRPGDLTVSVHLCRGNFKGMSFSEGSYARIAKKVFNELDVDTFYLEYDNDRAGNFEPLIHFPLDKVAVLGLVTTKTPEVENVAEISATPPTHFLR
ncbi:hypothetical protein HGRIS_007989 [Hohenbuehelia grisea]|uniref:Cobalamin-independent methionine synthase MetE C-terminal/archaeal domain-containing protein n=1 Tax=Hohenbuehelia grisea TaxID=104357 RepID=A0ABR3J6Y5_9AGAR